LCLFRNSCSAPPFGTDDDKNGDIPDRPAGVFESAATIDSDELVASAANGLPERPWWIELLLRKLLSGFSSCLLEKKLLFDAVIGVVGVFVFLLGGGLRLRSDGPCSWRAATFAAVGVLSGPRVIGGSRRGCRFFLCGIAAFLSVSVLRGCIDFLALGFRCTFSEALVDTGPVMLAVELLWILLVSKAKVDFRLSMNDSSAGDSFGDSYAFGIAGTGGTSSSSSIVDVLCRFTALGAGSRELGGRPRLIRGWIEPVDVRAVFKLLVDVIERPEL
jgi:hypothetical protein